MKEYIEELRPSSGEIFQIHIRDMIDQYPYTDAHVHDFIEILFCLEGEFIVTINDYTTTFTTDMMIIIGSRKVHSIRPANRPYGKFLVVKFQPEMIYSSYLSNLELQYLIPFLFESNEKKFVFQANAMIQSGLKDTFINVMNEIVSHSYGYEIALKAHVYMIILWVLRNIQQESENLLKSHTNTTILNIEKVLQYIENHYNEDITVRELASLVYMEYCYFSRIFKQLTNMSCTEYINSVRIKKSQSLLLTSDKNITEIGQMVGFDNTSYFIKQFRKFHGITPKEYKKVVNV